MSGNQIHHSQAMKPHTKKTNNMIMFKKSENIISIAGRDGYGPNKNNLEFEIQSSAMLVPNSLRLVGDIVFNGAYTKPINLAGAGINSVVEQLYIEYNGEHIVRIPSNAGYIADLHTKLHNSFEEDTMDEVLALKGTSFNSGVSKSFSMDMTKFGLDIPSFLPTSQGALRVKITLANLKKMCFGAVDGTKTVTDYTLNNVRLQGDFYRLSQSAADLLQKAMNGQRGASFIFQSYVQNTTGYSAGTDQNILVPLPYRNVVNSFFLPIQSNIAVNASAISTTDPIGVLKYPTPSSGYVDDLRVNFVGGEYVNMNSNAGETTKADHFLALLKCARKSPYDKSYGYGLSFAYGTDSYQIVGASFLKDEENDAHVVNNGTNAFASNGNLNIQFSLNTAPAGLQLLTIAKVTSELRVENGAVSLTQ